MPIRILIADDNAEVRSSLKAGFSVSDIHVVSEASTGDEAVSLARTRAVDVVLLDIEMPGGNGFEALARIKSENPDLPVLMHSSHDNSVVLNRSRELGADGYVVKGTDFGHLISTVRALVGQ